MSSKILMQDGHVLKQPRTLSAIFNLALAIIYVLVLHRLLVSYLCDGILDKLRILRFHSFLLPTICLIRVSLFDMLSVSLLLLELQSALDALYPLAEVNNSSVPVKMVLVSEAESALHALEALHFRVRDHVALQMRRPLE